MSLAFLLALVVAAGEPYAQPIIVGITVIVGSTIIGWAGRSVYRFFKRLERALVFVEKEMYPNGGTSLRDALNRIQQHLGINAPRSPTPPPDKEKP